MTDLMLAAAELPMPDEAALRAMTVPQLRRQLGEALTITARHLVHVAAIWRELERRGEDLSDLRSGLWTYMPMIAAGNLRAELVVRYAGHATLLRRLAALPAAEQDRLLEDDRVDVLVRDGEQWRIDRRSITRLGSHEIQQVFASDHVRPAEEQRSSATAAARRSALRPARVRVVDDRVAIGNASASREEMRQAVLAAVPSARERAAEKNDRPLTIMITQHQHDEIAAIAAQSGHTVAAIVRAALQTAGLMSK